MLVLRNLLCWMAVIALTSADRSVLFVKHAEGAAEQLQQELSSRSDPSSMHYLNWMTQLVSHPVSRAVSLSHSVSVTLSLSLCLCHSVSDTLSLTLCL